MNHDEAIRSQAAAGYLLGDLPEAERDAFEEHYFDCRECGDAVRSGATMLATGREVVENDTPFRRFRPLKTALASAAAAAAIVVATYQTAVIPRVQSSATRPVMEVLRPTPLMTSAMRGVIQEITISHNESTVLYPELPPDLPAYPRYQAQLSTAAGKVLNVSDVAVDIATSGNPIPLSVQPLPVGRYVLTILGVQTDGNRPELVRYSVVVQ